MLGTGFWVLGSAFGVLCVMDGYLVRKDRVDLMSVSSEGWCLGLLACHYWWWIVGWIASVGGSQPRRCYCFPVDELSYTVTELSWDGLGWAFRYTRIHMNIATSYTEVTSNKTPFPSHEFPSNSTSQYPVFWIGILFQALNTDFRYPPTPVVIAQKIP